MTNKLVLGMVLASLSFNTVMAGSIDERLKKDFVQSSSRTTLKDAGVFIAEGLTVFGIYKIFPRIDKKAIAAKIAQIEEVKASKTINQVVQDISDIDANTNNYFEDHNQNGVIGKDEKVGGVRPEVAQKLQKVNSERRLLVGEIETISTNMLRGQEELAGITAEVNSVTNKVSNYLSLTVDANKDGIVDAQESAANKLKPEAQLEVDKLRAQETQLKAALEDARRVSGINQNRIVQIDTEIQETLADIRNRSPLKLRPDMQIARDELVLKSKTALSTQQRSAQVLKLEKEVTILAQVGIRGIGKKIIRTVSVAAGVSIVVDMGLRGYLVVGLDRNAGWAPVVQATYNACSDYQTCLEAVNLSAEAQTYMGNVLGSAIQTAKQKMK